MSPSFRFRLGILGLLLVVAGLLVAPAAHAAPAAGSAQDPDATADRLTRDSGPRAPAPTRRLAGRP